MADNYNWRAQKRWERKMTGHTAVYDAFCNGEYTAMAGKPYRNSYPAGRRHDEFKRGYEETRRYAASR